jgi:hypothetical protein
MDFAIDSVRKSAVGLSWFKGNLLRPIFEGDYQNQVND